MNGPKIEQDEPKTKKIYQKYYTIRNFLDKKFETFQTISASKGYKSMLNNV